MNKGNRRSIRLKGFDYAQDGWYFITICTEGFREVSGNISDEGLFYPNEIGQTILEEWQATPTIRKDVYIDAFQLMPNHFHAIVVIGSKENPPNIIGFPNTSAPLASFKSPSQTIGAIVRGFKGASHKKIKQIDFTFRERFWQKNYYERIIRNQNELERIRFYIKNNPTKWLEDKIFFKKLLQKMEKR
jgi:putative transposase